MLVVAPYANSPAPYINDRQSSSSEYVSYYHPSQVDDRRFSTADFSELLTNPDFVYVLRRQQEIEELEKIKEKIKRLCGSFLSHGGDCIGIVAQRVFVSIASELIDLPFSEILAQYSPSNEEIRFDMLFENGLEVSIAKYLDSIVDDKVLFSLRVEGEPYIINSKRLEDLKNVLLETLS